MGATPDHIAQRVNTYLDRKIRILEGLIAEAKQDSGPWNETRLNQWIERQADQNRVLQQLAEEHILLLREWETTTDVSPEDQQAVETRSEQAERLTEDLREELDTIIQQLGAGKMECEAQLLHLRKSKRLLNDYAPSTDQSANYLNKQY